MGAVTGPARLAKLTVLMTSDKPDPSRQETAQFIGAGTCAYAGNCRLWMTRRVQFRIVVGLIACFPVQMRAQGPAARDYKNTPVNQLRFFADLLGSSGETAAASDIPLPNNVMVTRNGFLSLLYSFPLAKRYGGVQVGGGYARVKVNGPFGSTYSSGFTDPSLSFHVNFFGSPALSLEQFPKAVPRTFSSFHLTVNPPLGSYDRNSQVNTGGNRWSFTPVVNLDITPDKGVSWIDIYAGARLVTSNKAYLGNNVLTQNPLGVLTVHYSHNIGKQMWVAIGVHYDNGGRSFVNDIPQNDYANGFRPALAVSRRFGKFGVVLRYENTASQPNAAPTNALLSIRLSMPLFPF